MKVSFVERDAIDADFILDHKTAVLSSKLSLLVSKKGSTSGSTHLITDDLHPSRHPLSLLFSARFNSSAEILYQTSCQRSVQETSRWEVRSLSRSTRKVDELRISHPSRCKAREGAFRSRQVAEDGSSSSLAGRGQAGQVTLRECSSYQIFFRGLDERSP